MLALRSALIVGIVAKIRAQNAPQGDAGGRRASDGGKVIQELKIEAPSMTEEDQYGVVMPDKYRCDSCRAVMYHLDLELRKRHPKGGKRMKSWEYTDLFDEACRNSFEGYGIKLADGQNALSGAAFKKEDPKIMAGGGMIQMSGDSWKNRLGEVCRKIVYERIGEEEVYELFYKRLQAEANGDAESARLLDETLCRTELKDCVTGPKIPPAVASKEPEKKKPSKAKSAKEAKSKKALAVKEKADKKAAAAASSTGKAPETAGDSVQAKLGLEDFARRLATKHGHSSDEYIGSRTEREWEKLFLSMGSRIFNRMADSDEGTCRSEA